MVSLAGGGGDCKPYPEVWGEPIGMAVISRARVNISEGSAPMFYSTDRILVTHAGSLPRPADLRAMVVAKSAGEAYDAAALDRRLAEAVAETVRRQQGCGIDVVKDRELS